MGTDLSRRGPSSKFAFLDPHAQVISQLLDGVRFLAFFSTTGEPLWYWGFAPGRGARAVIRKLLADPCEVHLGPAGSDGWIAKFPIQSGTTGPQGSCVTVLNRSDPGRDAGVLHARIAPALACVHRALSVMPGQSPAALSDEAVDWFLDLGNGAAPADSAAADVPQLIATATRFLGCCAGRLFIPEADIDELYADASLGRPDAQTTLARLGTPIITQLAGRPSLVKNSPGTTRAKPPFKLLAASVPDSASATCGAVLFLRHDGAPDFSRRDQLAAQAFARYTSALTDARRKRPALLSRTGLHERMREWGTSEPHQHPHWIVYIHLDGLEAVNEALGFDAGDRLIEQIAGLLRARDVPDEALTARLSGHIFVLAMPRTDLRLVRRCTRALQQAVESLQRRHESELRIVTLSCGIAPFRCPHTDFPNVLSLAEIASKTARTRGGSRIETYEDTDSSMTRRRLDVITLANFQQILDNDQLTLYAQRIEPLQSTRRAGGYELLLRLTGEGHSQESAPSALFSAARRYRLEPDIDLWVLRNALASAARFESAVTHLDVGLSINVAGPSLSDQTFTRRARHWIRSSRIPASLITFEITETAAVSNITQARRFMDEMRSMGCRFALDDFGTGANSLKYLKDLQVDRVKIDGSFVTDLLSNALSLATVKAIVALAGELHIDTVAEFASSEAIIERLRELGVTYAQGYAVERPCPLNVVLERVQDQHLAGLAGLSF